VTFKLAGIICRDLGQKITGTTVYRQGK